MKNYLFPRKFQLIGWLLFIPSLIIGAYIFITDFPFPDVWQTVVNDAVIIGLTVGAIFIVCSKEQTEDEMIRAIRLASLLNSFYIYACILIASTIAVNGLAFMRFAMVNLVLLPIIYVIIFRLEMHRYNKLCENEEQD